MREPKYRIENGKKIYSMTMRIDSARRPLTASKIDTPTVPTQTNSAAIPAAEASDDPNIVRVRFRLVSAVDAFPGLGWLGHQLVRYGHKNAAAIREIPHHMSSRSRPVPLMWDHSDVMRDKAGIVVDGEWEESSDIPAGANGWLVVDRRYDPKAALGLELGTIDASSIAVATELERSHPDMDFNTFVELASEGVEVDGQPVGWLPVRLKEVVHHAMVWAGADPHSGPRGEMIRANQQLFAFDLTNTDIWQPEHTAEAVTPKKPRGGIKLENKSIQILDSLCRDMGFDVILSDEGMIPDDLQARLSKRLSATQAAATRYGELEARLSRLAEQHLPDAKFASSLDTLNALGDRLILAAYGDNYISDLRNEALRAFDLAHFSPDGIQSLAHKKLRELIESSTSVEDLKAFAKEWEPQASATLGDTRTTQGEEMPPVNAADDITAEQRRLRASFDRWKNGGK